MAAIFFYCHQIAYANEFDSILNNSFAITLTVSTRGTTCEKSNGSIIVTAAGGTTPYSYSINGKPSQFTGNFFSLSAGAYTILVTDAAGQTANQTATLTNTFSPPTNVTTQIVAPTGCTTKDASLTLTGTGGTLPYTYSIDHTNFQASNVFPNLSAGSYYCAVKDANGCTSPYIWYNTTNIPERCPLTQNGQDRSHQCVPFRSWLGLYNVSGGVAPYQYSLDGVNFQSDFLFYPLPAGLYTVSVKDATGANMLFSVALYDECPGTLNVNAQTQDAFCGQNASITVNPVDGLSPYLFSIDGVNFQTSNVFTGLTPGNYTITVKDAYSRLGYLLVMVGNSCLTINTTVTNTTCGFGNGMIEVQASGGQTPYQYSIDGRQFSNSNKFIQLTAKDYTVYVREANGFVTKKTIAVTNIAGPALSIVNVTGTDCTNSTGTATIMSNGGTAPFQYVLNAVTFQSTPVFSSLAQGSYKFTVNDANGCFDSYTVTIPVNSNLMVNAGNDLTICEGSSARLAATSNGNSFSWSSSIGLNNASLLSPAASPNTTTTYIVTATLGICTAKDTITVMVKPAPVPDAGKDTAICPQQQLALSGSGGSVYFWAPSAYLSNTSLANPIMSGSPVGNYVYSLSVKDDNGCNSLKPATIKVSVVSPVVYAGRDTVVLSNTPVQLNAIDPGNYGFIQYNWSPGSELNSASIPNPVAKANHDITYTVIAQTQNGCVASDDITIKVFNGIEIYVPTAFTPNGDGHNDMLKAIPVGIKEFKHFNIYNRWGQPVFQTANPARGWDGKLGGILQTGVFVWIAEGIDYSGNVIRRKGSTVLIQ